MDFKQDANHAYPPLQTSPTGLADPPKKNGDGLRSFISAIALLGAALVIAFSIAAFVVQSYQVDGESMESTLQHNDRLIVNKVPRTLARITQNPYIPARGDIIVFNQNGIFDVHAGTKKQLIKRVVGLPGERIVVDNGSITVYNNLRPNGFDPDAEGGYEIKRTESSGKMDITLESDEIFVAGDNRPNSEDSRYFGAVNVDNIVGKLILRILPIDKIKSF